MNGLANAGPPGGLTADVPNGLRPNRLVSPTWLWTGKPPAVPSLPRAVVGPKLFQQFRGERHVPILAALALADAHHHALLVDVLRPEVA